MALCDVLITSRVSFFTDKWLWIHFGFYILRLSFELSYDDMNFEYQLWQLISYIFPKLYEVIRMFIWHLFDLKTHFSRSSNYIHSGWSVFCTELNILHRNSVQNTSKLTFSLLLCVKILQLYFILCAFVSSL